MTDNEQEWAKRVAQWRESGLTSVEFCEGKDFTPGGLRNMAHVLKVRAAKVRVARVRVKPPARAQETEPVVVELGGARVVVRAGFSREALKGVLEVLRASL